MLSYGYYENIVGKLRGRVTKGNTQKKVALLECLKLQVRSVVVLKAQRLAATVVVIGAPVLGIPAMKTRAMRALA
jgi:threonine dehydrogenase-like Zn-dependent dehydrogenase